MRFLKRAVVFVLTAFVIFTVVVLILNAVGITVSDALIVGFYAFLGGEAGILGMLKRSENNNTDDKQGVG